MANDETMVREIATQLAMIDANGHLMEMDSLTVLDFVAELEKRIGKTVPSVHVRRTNFESVNAIVALVAQLKTADRP